MGLKVSYPLLQGMFRQQWITKPFVPLLITLTEFRVNSR